MVFEMSESDAVVPPATSSVPPEAITNWPEPLMVPPFQVYVPPLGTVRFADPCRVPKFWMKFFAELAMLTDTTALLLVMRSAPGWPLLSEPPLKLKVALKKSMKLVDDVACSAPPLRVPPLLKMMVLPAVGEFASVVPADCVY